MAQTAILPEGVLRSRLDDLAGSNWRRMRSGDPEAMWRDIAATVANWGITVHPDFSKRRQVLDLYKLARALDQGALTDYLPRSFDALLQNFSGSSPSRAVLLLNAARGAGARLFSKEPGAAATRQTIRDKPSRRWRNRDSSLLLDSGAAQAIARLYPEFAPVLLRLTEFRSDMAPYGCALRPCTVPLEG